MLIGRNFEQDFSLDQLVNWPEFKERDTDVGATWDLDQDRTHNAVNELTGFTTPTVYVDPVYDAAGNMTLATQAFRPGGSTGKADALKYDAWNRLVEYKDDDSGAVLQKNEYDGLGHWQPVVKCGREPVQSTLGTLHAPREAFLTRSVRATNSPNADICRREKPAALGPRLLPLRPKLPALRPPPSAPGSQP